MAEVLKIAVLYRRQHPQVFSDVSPAETPWQLEYLPERSVFGTPVAPRWDFFAVFFPAEQSPEDAGRRLASVFPGAHVVAYRLPDDPAPEPFERRADGLPRISLPIGFATARLLLESLTLARSNQRELVRYRQQQDEEREFFDTFVGAVESAWIASDRKLGLILLINKLLARLKAEECVVYLYGDDGATLHRAYSTGNIKDLDLFDYHANSSILESVVQSGSPYVNNNYSFELRVPFSKDGMVIRSVLCYPLVRRGEKVGVVEFLNGHDGGFSPEDQKAVESALAPLAVALRTVSMFETSERLTVTDDLTKLYNYRYLMQYLEAEVKRCLRYKKKVSLLFVDIDGFKRINDTFGHLVGSQALAEMGQVFRKILRETDVVGRYGGDEFVIVLPETPLNGAMVIAERIRKKVEDYEFAAQELRIRLTVSLGVANCPKHTLTAEGLIKKADAAMYRAKEISKNSIKVAV